jgi:hypothetical protein
MKTIQELRSTFDFKIQHYHIQLYQFVRKYEKNLVDWEVFLPSLGYDLQRPFVWTEFQKEELIWSVLLGRKVPTVSAISIYEENDELLQIIDGKQRLGTLVSFVQGRFPLHVDKKPFFYHQLPDDYKYAIKFFTISVNTLYQPLDKPFSDQDKINWFYFINFAGTQQDTEHMRKLQQSFSL